MRLVRWMSAPIALLGVIRLFFGVLWSEWGYALLGFLLLLIAAAVLAFVAEDPD